MIRELQRFSSVGYQRDSINWSGQRGRLYSWSVIFDAPTSFAYRTPYVLGLVEFQVGERRVLGTHMITDVEPLDFVASAPNSSRWFGYELEMVHRKLGESLGSYRYGWAARPVISNNE